MPATYVIDQKGNIVFSFIDNDPSIRCEIEDIVAAIPCAETEKVEEEEQPKKCRTVNRKNLASTFKDMKSFKTVFGKKKRSGKDILAKAFG